MDSGASRPSASSSAVFEVEARFSPRALPVSALKAAPTLKRCMRYRDEKRGMSPRVHITDDGYLIDE
ncbi:hypothetical protein EVAR_59489_1 [Eumeta japonica]|uniref:Uncharacterized protein n=1 Tax=Eumeta variegata TaxID=151549 RepID=A0A4C1YHT4_EUMVA|nr:hypothetical protein EVAR_59489_1 [Eumeta japonica]